MLDYSHVCSFFRLFRYRFASASASSVSILSSHCIHIINFQLSKNVYTTHPSIWHHFQNVSVIFNRTDRFLLIFSVFWLLYLRLTLWCPCIVHVFTCSRDFTKVELIYRGQFYRKICNMRRKKLPQNHHYHHSNIKHCQGTKKHAKINFFFKHCEQHKNYDI